MKLTSRGRYAVQAVLDIVENSNGKAVRLKDVADRQDLSLSFLQQLFNQLKHAGVVRAVKGPGGGYVLVHSPDKTTIFSVLSAVKEVTDYAINIKSDKPTKEFNSMSEFAHSLSESVKRVLDQTVSQISGNQ